MLATDPNVPPMDTDETVEHIDNIVRDLRKEEQLHLLDYAAWRLQMQESAIKVVSQ